MKINEILIESQLQEGPMLDKFGKAVGGVASGVAKGVGAVAGGIAGMGSAFKKGFSAGKTTVAGDEAPAKPSMVGDLAKGLGKDAYKGATGYDLPGQDKASLKKKAAQGGAAPAATTATGATPAATTAPAAPAATGAAPAAAKPAAAKPAATGASPAAAPNPKADTAYAQAQKAIAGLAPKQKSQLVKMLQSVPAVTAAAKAPAAKAPASKMANTPVSKTNTAKPGNPNQAEIDADRAKIMGQPDKVDAGPGAGAMGAMAGQLAKGGAAEPNTMANAPVSKTNTAKPGNPNAAPKPGMTADGQPHYDPATGKGAKFDGVTGEMTPAWKAEQDKKAAEKQTKAAPAQQDAAPAPAPAQQDAAPAPATPTTGQAATQAAGAGGNPEQAALDAMKAKNPKLAGMMAQAGMDDQGNDVEPVKKKGSKKKPAASDQATMDADRERNMGPTSDSIIRTRPMMAEGFSLFRKR
jgi:hypothetical protein